MSENTSANQNPEFKVPPKSPESGTSKKSTTPAPSKGGKGNATGVIALVIALAGIGAGYYFLQQNNLDKVALQQQLESLQAENQQLGSNLNAQLTETTQLTEASLNQSTQERQEIGQRLTSLNDTLTLLSSKTQWGNREWSLAEVNYLVQIAADRLYFMRDPATAAAAIKTAIERVDRMGDPELGVLRQRLQNDLIQVNQRKAINAQAVLEQFETTLAGFRPMPAHQENQAEEPPSTGDSGKLEANLMAKVKRSLQDRYRVVEHDRPLNALEKQTVSRQQFDLLLLRIESLRHALVTDNKSLFERELLSLESWTQANVDASQQQSIMNEISALREEELFPAMPTLEKTQALLRALVQGTPVPADDQPGNQTNAS